MRTIKTNIYQFNELNPDAQQKAIKDYYDNIDYSFLSNDLTESLISLLEQHNISYEVKPTLYYSLSSSQGDGLCFIGNFYYKDIKIVITHSDRYYYASSTDITYYDKDYGETEIGDSVDEFRKLYFEICDKLEKEGYSILEYRMNNNEFLEFSDDNDYEYYENGSLYVE